MDIVMECEVRQLPTFYISHFNDVFKSVWFYRHQTIHLVKNIRRYRKDTFSTESEIIVLQNT